MVFTLARLGAVDPDHSDANFSFKTLDTLAARGSWVEQRREDRSSMTACGSRRWSRRIGVVSTVFALLGFIIDARTASAAVELLRLDLVEERGRPGHEGFHPLPGEPSPGPGWALASLAGAEVTAATIHVRNASGGLLSSHAASGPGADGNLSAVASQLVVPGEPFRLELAGTDDGGTPFLFALERLYIPKNIQVAFDESLLILEPGLHEVSGRVKNSGTTAIFDLTVKDKHGFAVQISPTSLEVTGASFALFTVKINVPNIGPERMYVDVVAKAVNQVNPTLWNSGNCTVEIDRSPWIFSDGLETGDTTSWTEATP